MRRTISLILFLVMSVGLVPACTVPDGPEWKNFTDILNTMTPEQKAEARKWRANRKAAEWFSSKDPEETVFTALCDDAAGDQDPENTGELSRFVFKVKDVLSCLEGNVGADGGNKTYTKCLSKLLDDAEKMFLDNNLGLVPDCWAQWAPGYGYKGLPVLLPEWDPDHVSNDEVARGLVAAENPPAWVIALVVAGGVAGSVASQFLPVLCGFSFGEHWSCPSSPIYPPGQTPQPDWSAK